MILLTRIIIGLLISLLLQNTYALINNNIDNNQAPIEIKADHADINRKQGVGVFEGDVTVTQGAAHLTAIIAYTYTDDNQALTKARAKGDSETQAHFWSPVENDKPDLHAYADEIIFLPKDNKIILIGHAKISQGSDIYTAPRIEYDTKAQHVISRSSEAERTTIIIQPQNKSQA